MSSTDVNVQLVINEMSKAKYESLLNAEPCQINDNELYLVKEENIDAENKTIINVANPTLSSDAANKNYVDSKNIVSYDTYNSSDPTYKFTNKKLDVKGIVIGDQSNNDKYISLSTGGDFYIRNQSNGKNLIINLNNGFVKSNSKITYMSTPNFTSSDNDVVITKRYVDSTAIIKGPTINALSGNNNSVICIQNRHPSSGTQYPIMRFCSLPTTNTNVNRAWFSEFYYNKIHFQQGPDTDPIIFEYGRGSDNSIIRKTELDTAINSALGDIQSVLETI